MSALVARQLIAWAKAPEVEAGPCFAAQGAGVALELLYQMVKICQNGNQTIEDVAKYRSSATIWIQKTPQMEILP